MSDLIEFPVVLLFFAGTSQNSRDHPYYHSYYCSHNSCYCTYELLPTEHFSKFERYLVPSKGRRKSTRANH